MKLKFDSAKASADFERILKEEMEKLGDKFRQEVLREVRWVEALRDGQITYKVIDNIMNRITLEIRSNSWIIADSFGTGSKMLSPSENPDLWDYMGSEFWNPARSGTPIVGRPKGYYKDMFGRRRRSGGSFEGKNIEGLRYTVHRAEGGASRSVEIKPVTPTRALIIARAWVNQIYMPQLKQNLNTRFRFSNYFVRVP